MNTTIAASEAKAKFSELLERVAQGETFSITLHGQETATLIPAKRKSLKEIGELIDEIRATRSVLNPPGKPRLKIKDLINEGRP